VLHLGVENSAVQACITPMSTREATRQLAHKGPYKRRAEEETPLFLSMEQPILTGFLGLAVPTIWAQSMTA
jgi:hypothetical protein